VSLVDVDDIVGAGAPGGNTRIVRAFVEAKARLTAFVPVHDPSVVDSVWDQDVGARVSVTLRGTPGYQQPEVPLDATVGAKRTTDFGRTVRLDVRVGPGLLRVAVSERPPLPIHPKFWRELGLRPRDADAIVQKNFFHYRIFYAASSFRHLPVVTGGATSLHEVRARARLVDARRGLPRGRGPGAADWRIADPVMRALPRKARSSQEPASPETNGVTPHVPDLARHLGGDSPS